jgi:hypothetical protein
MLGRARTTLVAALALIAASACGGGGGGNALDNGGFEDGPDPWFALTSESWVPRFGISDGVAQTGEHAAFLPMRTDETSPETQILGVVQEVDPSTFPEEVSGWYRVENWQRAAEKQYLQAIVIAWDADNLPNAAEFGNHQIRYILAGIEQPPFEIRNAHFVFAGPAEPAQGEWVRFSFPVAEDFRRLWGAVPEGYGFIRVLFEVRFDDKPAESRPVADVYYDDLYLGPARPQDEQAAVGRRAYRFRVGS